MPRSNQEGLREERKVVYAGKSDRRALCLGEIPNVNRVESVGGGEEPETADVLYVSYVKLQHVFRNLPNAYIDVLANQSVVVSADTRTEVGLPKNDWVSKSKPKNLEIAKNNLQLMVNSNPDNPQYRVRSASTAIGENEAGTLAVARGELLCHVVLNANVAKVIASDNGFIEYVKFFNEFYSSETYSQNGLPAVSPMNLSGGISLPVLLTMDAVESVNGISVNDKDFNKVYETVKMGILTVACGFHPDVLKLINKDAVEYILRWKWLNEVTVHALGKDSEQKKVNA